MFQGQISDKKELEPHVTGASRVTVNETRFKSSAFFSFLFSGMADKALT